VRVLEDLRDVGRLARRLGDLLLEVLAEAVVRDPAAHRHAELLGHVGELDRVVLARPDRGAKVLANLLGVDVEGGRELDVGDVVAAEVDVHEAGDVQRGVGLAVVGVRSAGSSIRRCSWAASVSPSRGSNSRPYSPTPSASS